MSHQAVPPLTLRAKVAALLPLASNYLNVLVAGVVTLFAVPVYFRLLGPGEWGVLAFCLTAQGALLSLDAFMGQLLQKDMARAATRAERCLLWRKYRRRYWIVALSVLGLMLTAFTLLALSSFANQWEDGPVSMLVLGGVLAIWFAFQFANNANLGAWFGLQMHAVANCRSACFFLLKHVFALVALYWVSAQTLAYLIVFACLTILEYCANRTAIRSVIGGDKTASPVSSIHVQDEVTGADVVVTPENEPAVHWYIAATALALCSGQVDRLVLSAALEPSDYGQYFLIGSVWLSILSLLPPIQRTFLPRIAQQPMALKPLIAMWRPCIVLVAMPCIVLALFAEPTLAFWLGNPAIASNGAATLSIGLLGVLGIALYAPVGTWLFVQQHYRYLWRLNGLILAMQIAVLLWLYPVLGQQAGAWSWAVCGVIQLVVVIATVLRIHAHLRRDSSS